MVFIVIKIKLNLGSDINNDEVFKKTHGTWDHEKRIGKVQPPP
jgi:hypothetical protein